ncbi:MAG TPA: glycoside hydrolase domain-containing protein, partial [Parafilimonas sp.]|nr:glycoside hydrolase domain-containing protein [Parafilimonas sp.]
MQKKLPAVTLLLFILNFSFAQSRNAQYENFGDITSFSQPDQSKWQQLKSGYTFSQANINSRINYNNYPVSNPDKSVNMQGWIGEDVNAQLVVSAKKNISSLNVTVSNLISLSGNKTINNAQCKIGYVYYVITNNTGGICSVQPNAKYNTLIMPDIIDFHSNSSFVKSNTNRPIWLKIKIPFDAEPGTYKGTVTASADGNSQSINITLKVSNNKMPTAANKKFFLELWQYPIAE